MVYSRGFSSLIVLSLALLAFSSIAEARTIHVSVFESGQVRVGSGLFAPASADNCDEGLLFSFTESASPDPLVLSRRDQDQISGTINMEVRITAVCDALSGGQAAFEYGHFATNAGVIGEDLLIDGFAPSVTLALSVGESAAQVINYQAGGSSASDHQFSLRGNEISYFGGSTFGSATRERVIATIDVEGARFFDDADPELDRLGRERERDAIVALEIACASDEATAALREICEAVAGATGDDLLQVARAFDPHELAAVPGAATELGQIQTTNVSGRLAALRGGATGVSLEGLSFSYRGHRLDAGFLPDSLLRRVNGEGSGSTLLDQRWGVFVNGDISIGSRDERGKEVGFDFDAWGLTSGIDYRFDGNHIAGLAVGYSEYSADLDDDGGGLDSDTVALQAYGSISITDEFYIDLTLGHAWMDFEQDRVIDLSGFSGLTRQVVSGETSAEQLSASVSANYRIRLDGGWQITPYGQYRYTYTEIDGFSESGESAFAMRFPDQKMASRLFAAGTRASRAFNLDRSVMVPYIDVAYEHESGNDGFLLQPTLVDAPGILGPIVEISDPDRHFVRADLGASWVFQGGMQAFLSYSALLLEKDTTRHTFSTGVRWAF